MSIFDQILLWIRVDPMDFSLTVLFSLMIWSVIEVKISEIKNKKEEDSEDDLM